MGTFAGLGIHPDHLLDERDVRQRVDGPVHPHGPRPCPADPRDLLPGQPRGEGARLAAASRSSARAAARSAPRTPPTGTAPPSRMRASRITSTWATGCGHTGRVLPTSGRVKLPFNVDWAAKWSLFDITVEGCGKDLATAGGSRDRSDAISREVFQREPPINVAYEFLNIGGRKMSTSKGTGATAHAIADLLPPELLRFLFLRHRPRKAIEFDPEGDTIPGLFDEFDRICRRDRRQALPGRAAARSQGDPAPEPRRRRCRRRPGGSPVPAAVPPPRAAGPGAQRRPAGAHGGREGSAPRRCRAGHPRRACPGRRRVAGVIRPGPLQGRGARRGCPRGSPA